MEDVDDVPNTAKNQEQPKKEIEDEVHTAGIPIGAVIAIAISTMVVTFFVTCGIGYYLNRSGHLCCFTSHKNTVDGAELQEREAREDDKLRNQD